MAWTKTKQTELNRAVSRVVDSENSSRVFSIWISIQPVKKDKQWKIKKEKILHNQSSTIYMRIHADTPREDVRDECNVRSFGDAMRQKQYKHTVDIYLENKRTNQFNWMIVIVSLSMETIDYKHILASSHVTYRFIQSNGSIILCEKAIFGLLACLLVFFLLFIDSATLDFLMMSIQ